MLLSTELVRARRGRRSVASSRKTIQFSKSKNIHHLLGEFLFSLTNDWLLLRQTLTRSEYVDLLVASSLSHFSGLRESSSLAYNNCLCLNHLSFRRATTLTCVPYVWWFNLSTLLLTKKQSQMEFSTYVYLLHLLANIELTKCDLSTSSCCLFSLSLFVLLFFSHNHITEVCNQLSHHFRFQR